MRRLLAVLSGLVLGSAVATAQDCRLATPHPLGGVDLLHAATGWQTLVLEHPGVRTRRRRWRPPAPTATWC